MDYQRCQAGARKRCSCCWRSVAWKQIYMASMGKDEILLFMPAIKGNLWNHAGPKQKVDKLTLPPKSMPLKS